MEKRTAIRRSETLSAVFLCVKLGGSHVFSSACKIVNRLYVIS